MRGFTLIELLVVVLIIGVLASVALPQYQKAVAKARLAEFVIHARAVRDGLRMYSLANGSAATKVSDLDIWNSVQAGGHYIRTFVSLPGYSTWTCDFHWQGDLGFCYVYTEAGAKLAESLGWPPYSLGSSYHIMEDWRKK